MSPHSGVHFKVQVVFSEHREISLCGLRSVKAFKAALDKAGEGLDWAIHLLDNRLGSYWFRCI